MFYLKHPTLGNRHVPTLAECEKLQSEGWTRWPRTKEQKLGIVPAPPPAATPEPVEVEIPNTEPELPAAESPAETKPTTKKRSGF